jgi:hypothetical protein
MPGALGRPVGPEESHHLVPGRLPLYREVDEERTAEPGGGEAVQDLPVLLDP